MVEITHSEQVGRQDIRMPSRVWARLINYLPVAITYISRVAKRDTKLAEKLIEICPTSNPIPSFGPRWG